MAGGWNELCEVPSNPNHSTIPWNLSPPRRADGHLQLSSRVMRDPAPGGSAERCSPALRPRPMARGGAEPAQRWINSEMQKIDF